MKLTKIFYVRHELFHQWFGDLVTAESWSNITLNESFATYGEYLWREYKYGKANADELLEEFILYTRLNGMMGGADKKLVRYDYHRADDVFDVVSYQKGALILHMRSVMKLGMLRLGRELKNT